MRKVFALGTLLAIAAAASGASAAGFGIRLHGGYDYVRYGDFNAYADYVNDVVFPEARVAGEMESMHWMPAFGGEVLYSIAPWIRVGAGIARLRGTSSFDIALGSNSWSYEHGLTAIPVTVTGYVTIPAPLSGVKPFVFAGGGAYRTTVTFNEEVVIESDRSALDAELSAWGYGVHGGAGLAIGFSPHLSFDIAVSARYAKVTGFEGTAAETGEGTQDAFLVYHEGSSGEVLFGPGTAAELDEYGEGTVDLSGYGFTIGFTVSF